MTLLGLQLMLLGASSWNKSLTYDEPSHLNFGLGFLEHGRLLEADAQRMPVTVLNALAMRLIVAPRAGTISEQATVLICRLPTMLATLLLGLAVFGWSTRLYGQRAGLLSLALLVFCPNILAHGRLITNDLYTTLAVLAACWGFHRLCLAPSWPRFLLSAGLLGLAQACKFSAVVLVPAFLVVLLFPGVRRPLVGFLRQKPWRWILVAGFPVVVCVTLCAVYAFDGCFRPLAEYSFQSALFTSLKSRLPSLALPLPRVYVEGLDLTHYISTHPGGLRGHNYLLGRVSDEGWWYYYLVVGLFKVPLGTLGLLLVRAADRIRTLPASAMAVAGRAGLGGPGAGLFLVLPAALWLAVFSVLSSVQLGIRYVLPALPLLFVYAGGLLAPEQERERQPPWRLRLALVLLLFTALSAAASFPDYISYTNELVFPRDKAYRIMADSNLEWGQDRLYLRQYLERHPEATLNPRVPTAGHLVVRLNFLTGVMIHEEHYRWLRENLEPVGTIHGSFLVYQVTEAELTAALRGEQ